MVSMWYSIFLDTGSIQWEKTLRDWKEEYLGEVGPRLLEKDMDTTTKHEGHSTEDIPM